MRLAAVLVSCCAWQAAALIDWCPFVEKNPDFHQWRNLSLLLREQTLRVVAFHEPPWSSINLSAPAGFGWGLQISGFEIELMKRIAQEGQFDIQYSHRFVEAGGSWTDALMEVKDQYDLVAGGGWIDTSARRKRGVTFTTSINNQGVVLAMKKPQKKTPSMWDNAFFFLKPYTADAYPIIVGMSVLPAFFIWVLERKRQPGVEGAAESQFMGMLAIMGWGDFTWANSWFARINMALWAFLCLIILSGYTASLVNFLISEQVGSIGVSGPTDFLNKGYTACLPQGWGSVAVIRAKWKKFGGRLLEVPPANLTEKVANGECSGIMMQHDYMRIMLQGGPPSNPPQDGGEDFGCRAQMVGPTEINGVGAFPAGNSNCRWFVIQVIDSIIRRLSEQQVIEQLFSASVSRETRFSTGKPRCSTRPPDPPSTLRLGPDHLVGLVLVTLPAMVLLTLASTLLQAVIGRDIAVDTKALSVDMQAIEQAADTAVQALQPKRLSTRMSMRNMKVAPVSTSPRSNTQVSPKRGSPTVGFCADPT